jgi:soluble lytic murein transglycosylase-like protein
MSLLTTTTSRVSSVCVAVILFGAGLFLGVVLERKTQTAQVKVMELREQRILAAIVKRNPQATVREFSDFPAKLVQEAERLNLDFRYIMAIIDRESEWNPQAVSSAGAIGLMQVMPRTADIVVKRMGWEGYEPPVIVKGSGKYSSLGSLGDPYWNLRIGMQYLRWQIDDFGLGPDHLRAYNRGPSLARQYWPADRYAEDIGMRLVKLVNEVK